MLGGSLDRWVASPSREIMCDEFARKFKDINCRMLMLFTGFASYPNLDVLILIFQA